jgi:hypothetical protein
MLVSVRCNEYGVAQGEWLQQGRLVAWRLGGWVDGWIGGLVDGWKRVAGPSYLI